MDDNIAAFVGITNASIPKAESYLRVSDGDLHQAIQLFFDTGGIDIDHSPVSHTTTAGISSTSGPMPGGHSNPIALDDDDVEDEDFQAALNASQLTSQARPAVAGGNSGQIVPPSTIDVPTAVEDDEAMAMRLQEEMYADSVNRVDPNGVRAPIARTTETLVGPDEEFVSRMRGTRGSGGRLGIFNQRPPTGAVWGEGPPSRRQLSEATGGASERSTKSQTLAEMFRPPYEIIEHLSFDEARDQAKEDKKWILINIQDSSIFDCQVLNRDIWKAKEVKDTIKENFLFLQYDRSGIDGQNYVRLYFPHAIDVPPTSALNPFPIIAIVDPRTGEQVKTWTETPKKPLEFVMQLLEFLDRYSLSHNAKNPVQRVSKPKVDIGHMTEEEMLDWALRSSLNGDEEISHDPDAYTHNDTSSARHEAGKGKKVEEEDLMDFDDDDEPQQVPQQKNLQTPFERIPKDRKHVEPPVGAPGTTRIQLKLADGSRVVRRFLLQDPVGRIYEYVKANLLPEQAMKTGEEVTAATSGRQFELVSLGKNLIDQLAMTIEQAGLKMGTIMIEFVDNE